MAFRDLGERVNTALNYFRRTAEFMPVYPAAENELRHSLQLWE
jgi:hypothetical protein